MLAYYITSTSMFCRWMEFGFPYKQPLSVYQYYQSQLSIMTIVETAIYREKYIYILGRCIFYGTLQIFFQGCQSRPQPYLKPMVSHKIVTFVSLSRGPYQVLTAGASRARVSRRQGPHSLRLLPFSQPLPKVYLTIVIQKV